MRTMTLYHLYSYLLFVLTLSAATELARANPVGQYSKIRKSFSGTGLQATSTDSRYNSNNVNNAYNANNANVGPGNECDNDPIGLFRIGAGGFLPPPISSTTIGVTSDVTKLKARPSRRARFVEKLSFILKACVSASASSGDLPKAAQIPKNPAPPSSSSSFRVFPYYSPVTRHYYSPAVTVESLRKRYGER